MKAKGKLTNHIVTTLFKITLAIVTILADDDIAAREEAVRLALKTGRANNQSCDAVT